MAEEKATNGKAADVPLFNPVALKNFVDQFPMLLEGKQNYALNGRFKFSKETLARFQQDALDAMHDAANRRIQQLRMAHQGISGEEAIAFFGVRETGELDPKTELPAVEANERALTL